VTGAVVAVGEQLVDHPDRIGDVTALGLDKTLFAKLGEYRTQSWSTQIVDVRRVQLLDVVPDRTAPEPCRWLTVQPCEWRDRIEWVTLDLSTSYRNAFDTMLPLAVQVADPFHVVKLAGTALDEVRRRVQNETCGHRGRRDDPLWRVRRRLSIAAERLTVDQHAQRFCQTSWTATNTSGDTTNSKVKHPSADCHQPHDRVQLIPTEKLADVNAFWPRSAVRFQLTLVRISIARRQDVATCSWM
jgi:hypothetical protein